MSGNEQSNHLIRCNICNDDADLAYYKKELMCSNCAKDEMFKDGSVYREITNHNGS